MSHTPGDMISKMRALYGRQLIRRGFVTKDPAICGELSRIGLYLNPYLKPVQAVWLGYEKVRGVGVCSDKKVRTGLTLSG